MSTCFVIMPYGGSDDKARKHYAGVYQSIIVPAANKAGYQVKRSDFAGEPGNITHDIVKDLTESDIVIADLTAANANVFYELGIRHTARKSGTVHIIDATHSLPFDVRQYRAITYTTELADLPRVIDEIVLAIQKRAEQVNRSDNLVHDAVPELPLDVRSIGDRALEVQVRQFQQQLSQLQQERDDLHQRLLVFDPTGSWGATTEQLDIEAIFSEADEIMRSSGEHVLLHLSNAVHTGGSDTFVKELRQVITSPYLSSNDFQEISNMCHRFGLMEHRRATLEVAVKRYPSEESLFLALVDAYDDSNNPVIKERGRTMLESFLDVQHVSTGPQLKALKRKPIESFTLLFNFYFNLGKPEWVLSFCKSYEALGGSDSSIVRNKARALGELGRIVEAEEEFKRAIAQDPTNDSNHAFYSNFLDNEERYEEAYEEYEKALINDPKDPGRYLNVAIQILNRGLIREANGQIFMLANRSDRLKSAVPLIITAIDLSQGNQLVRQRCISVLVRAEGLAEAQAIANGDPIVGHYDLSTLNYINRQIDQAQVTQQAKRLIPMPQAATPSIEEQV